VAELKAKDQAFGLKDLAIGGKDLLELGWPKGPSMGLALAELLEAVLDDPELNTRERLLSIAVKLKEKYGVRRVKTPVTAGYSFFTDCSSSASAPPAAIMAS
jgi:hypothetical protein